MLRVYFIHQLYIHPSTNPYIILYIAEGCGITEQKPRNVRHLTIDRDAVVAWMETKGFL